MASIATHPRDLEFVWPQLRLAGDNSKRRSV